MYGRKWPNLEQIATEVIFMAKYSENIQGLQKKVYKNISGGTFLKHPLKSTSHLAHVDLRKNVLFGQVSFHRLDFSRFPIDDP